ncbi:protein tilB homolog [Exaiptasia diaphana]|uniref:U2A'/phosphoprotein 32 family A C-terminal domain-containing protein n=1 Tax=Exaiptasia diaphana TaxID=2652724 RepID=A0A913XU94_EXADI|nr:protein tilB homolog [Exaiptasia diaphana]KXJ24783.1 Protein tilB-like [Exaiptasia diaphana]
MVRITEDLLRKRAEHNNCEIFTLEEVSLHQSEIERIELLDKFCRDLKIIYLQSNLIPKIENVGRLKNLEYLNLALNNITRIENLEGCESLKKLDLTVNFVGELTSIVSLKGNYNLRELYLTGNPCTDYEGYREYVIATLTQLRSLDGTEVEKSERILAMQEYQSIEVKIHQQERDYLVKKEKEKKNTEQEKENKEVQKQKDEELKQARGDNWYTDIPGENKSTKSEEDDEAAEKRFWEEKVEYTPESRLELHRHIEEKRKEKENRDKSRLDDVKHKRVLRYFSNDDRPLNINQGRWDFHLEDDVDNNMFILDFPCYRHIDTSLMDVDVQPNYVRVTVKDKVFQLALSEEVNPDSSSAKRSQTTGHLLVTMPKMKQILKPPKKIQNKPVRKENTSENEEKRVKHEKLEVDSTAGSEMDFSSIVNSKTTVSSTKHQESNVHQKEISEDFIDDPDVPPLM